MQKSQTFAAILALVLTVLAAQTWWSDVRFRARATRTTGTLVGFHTVQVRSLFEIVGELHPIIAFVDESGAPRRFTVQATTARVGVAASTPLGSEVEAAVLYDPADPDRARLEVERRWRGALILLVAAVGLLVTPQILARAFRERTASPTDPPSN